MEAAPYAFAPSERQADMVMNDGLAMHTCSQPGMRKILIVADDLSGAADCASAFAKAGMDAWVAFDGDARQLPASARVIAVDADSRRMPAAQAALVHQALHARYRDDDILLYKKIDSTLRGNFAEELAAIAASAGLAIVAPAFPASGRTTRNGCQYLHGRPLEQSEVWRAEGMAGAAHIPGMLERQGLRTVAVDCTMLRQGMSRLAAQLASCARDGVQAVVCDAETDDDLGLIAQASLESHAPCFWVGSAGLAAHLAAVASRAAQATTAGTMPPAPAILEAGGAILTVVGSLSGVSRRQADRLHAATGIARVDAAASVLRQGVTHAQWPELRQRLGAALARGCDLLLTIGMDEDAVDMADGLRLCQALAGLVAPLAGKVGALISTGGETSRALLCAMGYHSLHMAGEIEAGVPLSVAAGPRPLAVITKAGAFGEAETLLNCYQVLAQARGSAAPCLPHPMKG